jgi:hypothetical protein
MHARHLTVVLLLIAAPGCTDPLTEKCQELSKKHVEFAKTNWKQDYTVLRTEGFYSKKLDACIHAEIAEVGVKAEIRDLTHSVMRDGGHQNLLLNCDHDGADSVRLDKMKQYQGLVFKVPHSEWLDDGFGGPPRTLKAPANPYTKEQCRKVFDKWIAELKSQ